LRAGAPLVRALLGLLLLAAPAAAQDRTAATFADWSLLCETQPRRQCELSSTLAGGEGRPQAQLRVGRPGSEGPLLVQALIPLSAFLPAQVRLVLGGATTTLVFQRCLPQACLAVVELDDALLARLRAEPGGARLVFQDVARREVSVPISFNGFARAHAALTEAPPARR
jgi:invasion protein IalB